MSTCSQEGILRLILVYQQHCEDIALLPVSISLPTLQINLKPVCKNHIMLYHMQVNIEK